MHKFLLSSLIVLTSCGTLHPADASVAAPSPTQNWVGSLSSYTKAGAQHIFSTDGMKDAAAAYGLMMAGTLIHELAHAAVAKAWCGLPVDVRIGGPRGKEPFFKLAGVEFAGFNPMESNARWEEHWPQDEAIYQQHKVTPVQEAAISASGPIAQALTGYCLYRWLKNKEGLYFAKAVAIGLMLDTIIGFNGVYGALRQPWTDPARFIGHIKKCCSKSSAKSPYAGGAAAATGS